jgi:6-phosphogluconate dehydrogenase
VIDGGNSHFTDTERREAFLNEKESSFSVSVSRVVKKVRGMVRAS